MPGLLGLGRVIGRAVVVLRHALLLLAFVLLGCNQIPEGRTVVSEVQIRGNEAIGDGDVEEKIATTETTKFLGLFPGVLYEYEVFDRYVVQRDLARVEAFYRTKGYYHAKARAGRVHPLSGRKVRVEVVVDEGEVVRVRDVRVEGLEGLPEEIAEAARRAAAEGLPEGRPFEEEAFDQTKTAVRRALSDRAYAYAKVEHEAAVDIVADKADVVFRVRPGKATVMGPITIEGLGELPEKPVRRALDLRVGEPYSEADLELAQQALLELGVFASVMVKPDLPDPPRVDDMVPILVQLEPARLRTVRLGGGIEFDAIKTDIHAVAGWESRNFLGGLRTFNVQFRPGLVLYPLRVNNITAPENLLFEERLRAELRQPGFLEARTNGFIRPEVNVYPVLLDPNPPENAPVLGYAEARNAIGLDRTWWRLYNAISHNLHVAYPFSYLGPKDETLSTIVISFPELLTHLDFRDDRVHPRKGIFFINTLQVAGGLFGGKADDVKIQPDLRGYVPLSRRVVLAGRASVGFLWARNYGSVIQSPRAEFPPFTREETLDYQLTFFRGFFSGGPTSNRGYPLRGVGPHAVVPFLTPEFEQQRQALDCGPECRVPTGGFTLWEASVELRFAVTGPLSAASFCDASDVSPRANDIRLSHLHLSCGGGVRYDTPVGPIRLDVGYRLPGLQVIGGLTPDEKRPDTFPLGIPIAVHLGIGEAY